MLSLYISMSYKCMYILYICLFVIYIYVYIYICIYIYNIYVEISTGNKQQMY